MLRELGLRLPTNIDLTDFPFYDPPLDYDAQFARSRAPDATVLRGKCQGESKEPTGSPEEMTEALHSRRDVQTEDGKVADADESYTTSHSPKRLKHLHWVD